MRILTFNWHEAYICLLAKTGHPIDIVERFKGGSQVWFYETRPLPPNARIVREATARRGLREHTYDAVICHNVKDLLWVQEWPVRKILVFHNKLSTEIALGHNSVDLDSYRNEVAQLLAATDDLELVFISESKRDDWGFEGAVITPGIDLDEYGGYDGHDSRVLRVGNFMLERDLMLGFSLQEEVLGSDIPSTILGLNHPEAGARFTRSWDDLRECFRAHRVYLNTTLEPFEDGYNLSMLEAMATGAPIVSYANGSSPIVDGVNGFIASDPETLRERIRMLLSDLNLARRLGAEARRTVAQEFGMQKFVDRWNGMLKTASRTTPRPKLAVVPGPHTDGRTKVLLAYVSYPATTARYIETSLRRHHDVLTVGPAIGPEIIRAWNLEAMREPVRPHDIQCDADVDLERVMRSLPASWRPDLVLWVESVPGYYPRNIPQLDCPTAAYMIDSHLKLSTHLTWAPRFDWVFVAQRAYVDEFRAAGCSRVRWLPLACDPGIHGKASLAKRYDVGFVGSLTPEHGMRCERIARLAQRFDVHVERSFLRDMARTFSASRIVFNDAVKHDLNMRVFEAMASGSMLLSDHAVGSGLEEMFTDREHLVYYDDATLDDLVEHYLTHADERESIAAAGRAEVLRWHTYDHRVESLLHAALGFDGVSADPTDSGVVADALLAEGLERVRDRKYDLALPRLLAITAQRDLGPMERVAWHNAVAECLEHSGDAADARARRRASLEAAGPAHASRILPLLAA